MTSDESYLEMKIYPVMKVIVVREVITCELQNDKKFYAVKNVEIRMYADIHHLCAFYEY